MTVAERTECTCRRQRRLWNSPAAASPARPRESGTEASREGRRVRIGAASGIGGASEASHCSEPMNRSFSTKTSSCSPCSSGFAVAVAVVMFLGFAFDFEFEFPFFALAFSDFKASEKERERKSKRKCLFGDSEKESLSERESESEGGFNFESN